MASRTEGRKGRALQSLHLAAGRVCTLTTIIRGRGGGNILADESLAEEEGIELCTEADIDVGCGDGPELSANH